jgi:hypothetical protein
MSNNQRIKRRKKYKIILNSRFKLLNVGRENDFNSLDDELRESLVIMLEHIQKDGFLTQERANVIIDDHLKMMDDKKNGLY